MGERRTACRVLIGKPEGKGQVGSPGHRWKYNIKFVLRRSVGIVKWIDLAQDRYKWWAVVETVMNCWFQ
jgi:hypothetical protein